MIKSVMVSHESYASDYLITNYRPLDWQRRGLQKTATGYGTKIPTLHTVNFQGRERRIYVDICGNTGHTYIIVNKEKVTVH